MASQHIVTLPGYTPEAPELLKCHMHGGGVCFSSRVPLYVLTVSTCQTEAIVMWRIH